MMAFASLTSLRNSFRCPKNFCRYTNDIQILKNFCKDVDDVVSEGGKACSGSHNGEPYERNAKNKSYAMNSPLSGSC